MGDGAFTDFGSEIAAIVNQGFGEPAPSDPAPAPEPAPAATDFIAQPDAAPDQGGQPAGDDIWSQWLQDEPAEETDPWAKFTAEGLDQINDPQQLRQALMDRQAFIDSQRDRAGVWGKHEKMAEAIGGEEFGTKAYSWAQSLLFGNQPLPEDPRYTYLDKFLYDLYEHHEPTWRNLVNRAIAPMLSPESGRDYERVRAKVFENEGLPMTMIEDFKTVARSGGIANVALGEEAEFLSEIPQHLHEVFKSLPAEIRKQMVDGSVAAARFHLEERNQQYQERKAQSEYRAQMEERAKHEREHKNEQAFFEQTAEAFEALTKHFQTKGLDELRAMGAAALAVMQIERSYWSGDRNTKALFQQMRDHIRDGNDAGILTGRKQYLKLITEAGRKGLQERAKKYAKTPGAPTQKQPPNGAPQQHFQPDRQPGDQTPDDPTAAIQQIMVRHGFPLS